MIDKMKRLITFKSNTFTLIEKNYVIHERKLLVIKKDLKKRKYYIKNYIITVVRIDHAKL